MITKHAAASLAVSSARRKCVVLAASVLGAVTLAALPSLTARADTFTVTGNLTNVAASLNITSLTNGQVVFSFANATPGGITSKLTGIGFDLSTNGPFTLGAPNPNNTNFDFDTSPGNVPQFNTASLDFALITGNNFAGGNPPSGLANGQSSVFYTVNGNFTGLSQLSVAQGFYARFQAIDGTTAGSDVAHQLTSTPNPIPEPGEWAVMGMAGTSVMGLMVRARRRRNGKAAA